MNTEKATKLYRELVALAPRHLPTLASSLQNLASILWNVGRQEEAIAACEEAVSIMRKVVHPETYLLPALADALDQLVGYLTEKGDIISTSVTTTESTKVRRTYTSLPPELDFLFEKLLYPLEMRALLTSSPSYPTILQPGSTHAPADDVERAPSLLRIFQNSFQNPRVVSYGCEKSI
ncbi:hypothetical protein B0H13DRAFT_2517751 [Mycena leptocephala]|nr:hypothetical protein B0H13DRAFT_2517751 [Mycena leptocephala]